MNKIEVKMIDGRVTIESVPVKNIDEDAILRQAQAKPKSKANNGRPIRVTVRKQSRNELCNCGSKKKFKNCCLVKA